MAERAADQRTLLHVALWPCEGLGQGRTRRDRTPHGCGAWVVAAAGETVLGGASRPSHVSSCSGCLGLVVLPPSPLINSWDLMSFVLSHTSHVSVP